jgi:hypothetical protein
VRRPSKTIRPEGSPEQLKPSKTAGGTIATLSAGSVVANASCAYRRYKHKNLVFCAHFFVESPKGLCNKEVITWRTTDWTGSATVKLKQGGFLEWQKKEIL